MYFKENSFHKNKLIVRLKKKKIKYGAYTINGHGLILFHLEMNCFEYSRRKFYTL